MRLKTILILFFLSFLAEELAAQVYRGCRSGGVIYTTPPAFLYGWTGGISEPCPPGATSSTQHVQFIRNAPTPNSCPVGLLSLGGSGILVDYGIVYCPLDSLSTFTLFLFAVIGLYKIRGPLLKV